MLVVSIQCLVIYRILVSRPNYQGLGLGLKTWCPRSWSWSRDLLTKVLLLVSRPGDQGLGLGLESFSKVLITSLVTMLFASQFNSFSLLYLSRHQDPYTKCVRPPRFYHVGPDVVYPGPRQQPILRHHLGLNVPQVFYSIISTYASRAAASSNHSRCFLERVNSRVLLVSDGRSL